jgi:Zn-dependent peptidase ImmA (M78 family)
MDWIDEIVLVETYGTNDPYELCDLLEIQIINTDANSAILSGYNSVYFRCFHGQEIIYIRNDLNTSHKEFYLRHELGHAILHTHILNSLNEGLVNIGKNEKQANYFALKLSEIIFDEIELKQFTLEQISSSLEIPLVALKQLANN